MTANRVKQLFSRHKLFISPDLSDEEFLRQMSNHYLVGTYLDKHPKSRALYRKGELSYHQILKAAEEQMNAEEREARQKRHCQDTGDAKEGIQAERNSREILGISSDSSLPHSESE